MIIRVPDYIEEVVSVEAGEEVSREIHWEGRNHTWLSYRAKKPVRIDLLIDGEALREMARRAMRNKGRRCKDGPFTLKCTAPVELEVIR